MGRGGPASFNALQATLSRGVGLRHCESKRGGNVDRDYSRMLRVEVMMNRKIERIEER
jgi:hypothetical protein